MIKFSHELAVYMCKHTCRHTYVYIYIRIYTHIQIHKFFSHVHVSFDNTDFVYINATAVYMESSGVC